MPTLIASPAPATVASFIEAILASGEVKNPGGDFVSLALRRSLVRALNRLSSVRMPWSEAEFSLTTVIDHAEYASGHSGFPKDAAAFVVVEFDMGSSVYLELELVDLPAVRQSLRREENVTTGASPRVVTWWADKLIVAPAPTTAATLRGWYHRDARRDTATGTLIGTTAVSDGFTNAWLAAGEDLAWNKVLEIYHLAFAVDPDRAAFYASQFEDALKAVEEEWTRRSRPGLQTAAYW